MKVEEELRGNFREFAESKGLGGVLSLSSRSYNALYRANIETVDELLLLSEKDLSKIRQLGPASHREVIDKLKQYQTTINITPKWDTYDSQVKGSV